MAVNHYRAFGGIEAAPARARQIHFGPGVQLVFLLRVAEQIPADKPGRNAQTPAGRHKQRSVVAAGALPQRQGLFGGVGSAHFPNLVGKLLNRLIQGHQKRNCLPVGPGGNPLGPVFNAARHARPLQIRPQQIFYVFGVAKRYALGVERKQDKIKRIKLIGLKLQFGRYVQVPRERLEIRQLLNVAFDVDVAVDLRRYGVDG